jgi:hypothetical protein
MTRFLLIVLLVTAAGSARSDQAEQNCALAAPPLEAAINTNHALYFFIYPRTLGATYTGCQTMWDEKSRKLWVARFVDGRPVEFVINWPARQRRCEYKDGAIVSGDAKVCLSFETLLRDGIRSIPKTLEPAVPANRDPRRSNVP